MKRFDVIVIGAGPGGYVSAMRCAQLGLNTAVIDDWLTSDEHYSLGGTCLNVGCIPSKALLDSSEKYHQLNHGLSEHGIHVNGVSLDIGAMISRKNNIVAAMCGGIAALFAKHKIAWIKGHGRLLDNKLVEIISTDSNTNPETIAANNIIIATGSHPRSLAIAPIDKERIVDSAGALAFTDVPKRLVVIGGGVIGLELGSVWQRLGSDVTLLARGDQFLRSVDTQVSTIAFDQFSMQGLDIKLGAKPISTKSDNNSVTITYEHNGEKHTLNADKLLVSTGRTPNTTGLSALEIGLTIDDQGFIVVDDHCQTNISGIYAIGDVVRGPMLAHKASEEGIAVAERITGQKSHVNYATIPWVIYTSPEIAWAGPTSQELDKEGVSYRSGVFPFKANGRAHAMGATAGIVKLLGDAKTDRLLGAHIIGPNASEMIAEIVLAMEFDACTEDIARTIHAHPTLSEALHEAALAVDKRTLHI